MRAARLVAPGRMAVDDVPDPEQVEGSVRIQTLVAAICGSDLHRVFDYQAEPFPTPPGFPGHESVGIVDDPGRTALEPGELVLSLPEGAGARAFAEVQVVPAHHLIRADGLGATGLLMVQQLGTVVYALKRFWPGEPGARAAVFGAGAAGLHFVQLLKLRGFATVLAVDLSARRLDAARRKGADVVIRAGDDDPVAAIMDVTNGLGADLVVEAAGKDRTRCQAMESVAHGGTIGLFGLPEKPGYSAFPFEAIFRQQPRVVMTVGAQTEPGLASFRKALTLVSQRQVDVSEILSEVLPLDEIDTAFHIARYDPDRAIKIGLEFQLR